MSGYHDPIGLELFNNAVHSIADEMAVTVHRTTYSGVLKDNMDYSTAFCDADGLLVAQGLTLPGHLGSVPTAMEAVMARYRDEMAEGDVFCLNDPFEGGMHLPDIFVFKPIFHQGRRVAFAATVCHHTDVGGRVAGSNASDSTEIYQEGLRIPPMRLIERGKPNRTLWELIERNVRVPVRVFGDLRAQLAACHVAERAFLELVERHGPDKVAEYMRELIDYSERVTRAALQELPEGSYSFEDYIDDDGVDFGRPIRLKVTITRKGDGLIADWTGTSPQVKGAINNTLSFTKAATYCAVKSALSTEVPSNEGLFRCIEVIAPPGTIANAVLPAACAARGLTGFRMTDCLLGAFAMMLPDRIPAASEGGNTGISIGGYDTERRPFIYVDFVCGVWGGRPFADGLEGNAHLFANMAAHSVEITEAEQPLQITAYEYLPDAAGPGRYRGGAPFRRDYRFLESEAVLQVRADRHAFRPYGLYGGGPGAPSQNAMNPDTDRERELTAKVTTTIRRGDVFRHDSAGGGGWGDPLEREPWRVLKDWRDEFVSLEAARRDYGVVIDPAARRVDEAATAELRDRRRRERGWTEVPRVTADAPPEVSEAAD